MRFPVEFHFLGRAIPAHGVLELLAYSAGFQLYLLLRRKRGDKPAPFEKTMWILVGCVFGAFVGSKILAWIESPLDYWNNRYTLAALGGKTIVGGLLGGWIGVEIAKKRLGIWRSTGDLFVFPLILGQCIGRVGCFLTGLPDHTYGDFSNLPWAVDFGDGPRHPTQLYEIAFLILLAGILLVWQRRPRAEGALFRIYLMGYLLFRLAVEFIKPSFKPYAGLSAIQIASLAGAAVCFYQLLPRNQQLTIGETVR